VCITAYFTNTKLTGSYMLGLISEIIWLIIASPEHMGIFDIKTALQVTTLRYYVVMNYVRSFTLLKHHEETLQIFCLFA